MISDTRSIILISSRKFQWLFIFHSLLINRTCRCCCTLPKEKRSMVVCFFDRCCCQPLLTSYVLKTLPMSAIHGTWLRRCPLPWFDNLQMNFMRKLWRYVWQSQLEEFCRTHLVISARSISVYSELISLSYRFKTLMEFCIFCDPLKYSILEL